MKPRMFGLETEYGFSPMNGNGAVADRAAALGRFMEHAQRTLTHLPDRNSGGMFLASGGRFYRDSGNHPELTTPEVLNPWDACRYILAGDRVMARLAEEFAASESGISRVVITKCNVSYGSAATTWACHESYGHQVEPSRLPESLISHLVTRTIHTGGGGFNNRSLGLEFMISPRVAHLHEAVSDESQSNRGIYHTKDESLSGAGHHRLHVLCGESLSSEVGIWLKMGTTALVVALIEAGIQAGPSIKLRDPLGAMRKLALDTTCTARFPTMDGQERTAIEIQRTWLELAETHQGAAFMPDWTSEACRIWRDVLDRLAQGPQAVERTLEWAIKLSVFRQLAAASNIAWEAIPVWNQVLQPLSAVLPGRRINPRLRAMRNVQITPELLRSSEPIGEAMRAQEGVLEARGLNWDGLGDFLAFRSKAFELDTRFGEVGKDGVFQQLDNAGVLDHHVSGVDRIDEAIDHPPAEGRAHLRGECIRRFSGQSGNACCSWTGVWDLSNQRFLDLAEPFTSEEEWQEMPNGEEHDPVLRRHGDRLMMQIRQAARMYDYGRYDEAFRVLQSNAVTLQSHPTYRHQYLRLHALVQTRRGFPDGIDSLNEVASQHANSLALVADFAFAFRFRGLRPSSDIEYWFERGRDFVEDGSLPQQRAACAFHDHRAWYALSNGQPQEAFEIAGKVVDAQPASRVPPRLRARALATQGEALRQLGRREEAIEVLSQARSIQMSRRYHGDLVEFTIGMQARLEDDRSAGLAKFDEALHMCELLHHRVAEVRNRLLRQRYSGDSATAAETRARVVELRQETPMLAQCPTLAIVLENWDAWSSGEPLPAGLLPSGDFYQGI